MLLGITTFKARVLRRMRTILGLLAKVRPLAVGPTPFGNECNIRRSIYLYTLFLHLEVLWDSLKGLNVFIMNHNDLKAPPMLIVIRKSPYYIQYMFFLRDILSCSFKVSNRPVNSGGLVKYGSVVFRVQVEYGSGVFRVRVEYESGIFRFCGFRVNPTGHNRHLLYYYWGSKLGYKHSSYLITYRMHSLLFLNNNAMYLCRLKLTKMEGKTMPLIRIMFITTTTSLLKYEITTVEIK